MAQVKVKTDKPIYKLTMGPKEAQALASLTANCAENSYIYAIHEALDSADIDWSLDVTAEDHEGSPHIVVEQK